MNNSRQERLLKEYEIAWTRLNFVEEQVWRRSLIVFGIAFGPFIVFFQIKEQGVIESLVPLMVAAIFSTIILISLNKFLDRQRTVVRITYSRLHELEAVLGMRTALRVHQVDHWGEQTSPFLVRLSYTEKADLKRLRRSHVGPGLGWSTLSNLVWVGIIAWWLLVLREAILVIQLKKDDAEPRVWVLLVLVVVAVALILYIVVDMSIGQKKANNDQAI